MKLLAFNILVTVASSAAIEPLVVDGILELDCTAPSVSPASGAAFQANCASVGKSPGCCLFGLAGLALVCNAPTGV
ncbi:hypothetical protein NQ176_g4153 [Zarea fungicola]|uniref:Uncharacterized protein n=1 Tax=Zarea fungicola TaxID=93591 RepID=A0ACC1NEW9_9HYPO|nr:hypothetical protein NQ176_g4153 [Lecanicillium fungicola]